MYTHTHRTPIHIYLDVHIHTRCCLVCICESIGFDSIVPGSLGLPTRAARSLDSLGRHSGIFPGSLISISTIKPNNHK